MNPGLAALLNRSALRFDEKAKATKEEKVEEEEGENNHASFAVTATRKDKTSRR